MKQPSHPCSCAICKKETSSLGIVTHYLRSHGSESDKMLFAKKKNIRQLNILHYNQNPTYCKQCDSVIDYDRRHNNFCCQSCAGTYNNARKDYTSFTPGPPKQPKQPKQPKNYCTIRICKCKECGVWFSHKTQKQYCDKHRGTTGRMRDWYSFKFNMHDHPDLFDFTLISKIGFYSPGGKSGSYNLDGLSRDHKVSIKDAIKNNYDHYYITHPCNCELITQRENSKKHGTSSILYNELVQLVDEYDCKYVKG